MKAMADKVKSESELPIRKTIITIDKSQQEVFFVQLRKFADKYGFAIRIAPTTLSEEDFSIQMWREDFKIFGANPFEPGVFKMGVYKNKTEETPSMYLDTLISDLKDFVSEVQNATFIEEPQ